MADLSSLLGSAGVGGAIGQAVVRLELDTAKYQAEMKSAQASTVASTNAMGTSASKFAGLAKTAFLGAGVAAVAFGAFSVKAAIEANEAHIKLANTFKNNANLSDSSVEAFERQAGALRDLTGVDDEAIVSSQALLGAFDLTGKEVEKLTPLIVDLSAKYGVDLDAAAKAVGKAVEGNTGSLARYGITLDDAALQADAFGAVLQGLGKNAGFAEERAKAEPWRILGAQFEEVAEQVGQAILPAIQDLVGVFKALLPVLKTVAENFDLFLVGLGALAAYKYVPALLGAMKIQVAGLGAASATAALAVGILVIGLQDMAQTVPRANEAVKTLIAESISQFADETYKADDAVIKFGSHLLIARDNALSTQADINFVQEGIHQLRDAFEKGTLSERDFRLGLETLGLSADTVSRIVRETTNGMDDFTFHIDKAGRHVENFAGMSTPEFREWSKSTKESFHTAIFALEDFTTETDVTKHDVIRAFREMKQDAREFAHAMEDLPRGKWVNDEFIQFISDQGPQWIIGFSSLNKEKQQAMQEDWEESQRVFNHSIKGSFLDLNESLDKLDKKTTKHTIEIEYRYMGYDPTMPGMVPAPRGGSGGGQQP
jgi:hypothetical protein